MRMNIFWTSARNDHAVHGQYYAFANGGQCQFSASGITN
jgi:hypothetical protein